VRGIEASLSVLSRAILLWLLVLSYTGAKYLPRTNIGKMPSKRKYEEAIFVDFLTVDFSYTLSQVFAIRNRV